MSNPWRRRMIKKERNMKFATLFFIIILVYIIYKVIDFYF